MIKRQLWIWISGFFTKSNRCWTLWSLTSTFILDLTSFKFLFAHWDVSLCSLIVKLSSTKLTLGPIIVLLCCCHHASSTSSIWLAISSSCSLHSLPEHFTLGFPFRFLLILRLSWWLYRFLLLLSLSSRRRFVVLIVIIATFSFYFSLLFYIEDFALLNKHFLADFLMFKKCFFLELAPTSGTFNSITLLIIYSCILFRQFYILVLFKLIVKLRLWLLNLFLF